MLQGQSADFSREVSGSNGVFQVGNYQAHRCDYIKVQQTTLNNYR